MRKVCYYVLIGFFTVREYIRQRVEGDVWRFSFREIWELFDESHRKHLLGNAVPVPVAEWLARHLIEVRSP